MQELRRYGAWSVGIYAATLAGVVLRDLLSGVLLGVALSVLRVLLRLGKLRAEVRGGARGECVELHLRGALTFLGLPQLSDLLDSLRAARELRVHCAEAHYVDHACVVALGDFERKQRARGGEIWIDWGPVRPQSAAP